MNSEDDDTHNRALQLEAYCSSDDLSIDELRRRTEGIPQEDLHNSSFLHRACLNKNVTLEIVEYLLDLYPSANSCLDIPSRYIISSFPLHLACYNKDCPNEVIQLLFRKDQERYQLDHISHMAHDWGDTGIEVQYEGELYGGTPLHFYLSRTSNVDLDIVKKLAADPLVLLSCDMNKNYPLHHACRGGNYKVIRHLLERPMSSASVSERNADDMLPIHLFCEFVKGRWCEGETPEYTETIWRLLTAYPETVLNW